MLKRKLDVENIEDKDVTFIGDGGFKEFHRSRERLLKYFTKNKLDDAILNHLYGVFLIAPGNKGLGFYSQMTVKEYLAVIGGVFGISDTVTYSLCALFRNVDKRLKLPLLLVKERDIDKETTSMSDPTNLLSLEESLGRSVTFAYPSDQVVKVNPNNLAKHCGWPLKDAKALFRNMNELGKKVYLPKNNRPSEHVNRVSVCWQPDPPLRCWQIEDGTLAAKFISRHKNDIPIDDLSNLMSANPLPITDLQIWRSITKEWYEREHGFLWAKLSLQAQKRHLVNMIRHGSVGYTQAYSNVPSHLCDILHEAAFNAIMRQIANVFPFLRTECQRQWAYRDANNAQWDALDG